MDTDFVQKIEPGQLYLTFLVVDATKQMLMTGDGLPPTFLLSDNADYVENFSERHKDFLWLCSKSLDWAQVPLTAVKEGVDPLVLFTQESLQKQLDAVNALIKKERASPAELKSLRFREHCLLGCLKAVLGKLKLRTFGSMYYEIVRSQAVEGTLFLVSTVVVNNVAENEACRTGVFKAKSCKSLHPALLKSVLFYFYFILIFSIDLT